MTNPALGVYLHFPFCRSHCTYCDFFTQSYSGPSQTKVFAQSLSAEIPLSAAALGLRGRRVETIYVGGGTPSLLEMEDLEVILRSVRDTFEVDPGAEISLEANPEDVTEAKVGGLLEKGVNRISLGVQSFQPSVLKTLGREHDAKQACQAGKAVRAAGCRNLNLDLMLALPGQSLQNLAVDLSTLKRLEPDHVSAYLLEMDKETALRHGIERGEVPGVSQELAAAIYEETTRALTADGYVHYEISSFARPGRECRHNLKYWTDRPFLGCGPSSWSYLDGIRHRVTRGLEQYLKSVREGMPPPRESDRRSPRARMEEAIFAGLRLRSGVNLERIARAYGIANPLEHREEELGAAAREGLVEWSGSHLRLTRRGLPLANEVFRIFV